MQSSSYLGSGRDLAYHDLQIRGGGNIIGTAQSGHIKHIGYSLYLKMLESVLSSLTTQDYQTKQNKTINIKLNISAYISGDTISSDKVRLELYRRLGRCDDITQVYDIFEEIEDRFGKVDIYTKQFIDLIILKIKSRNKNIKKIINYENNITVVYNNDKQIKFESKSKDDEDIINSIFEYLSA